MRRIILVAVIATSTTYADAATLNGYLAGGQSNGVGRAGIVYKPSAADQSIRLYYELGDLDPTAYDRTIDEAPAGDRPDLPRWLQSVPPGASPLQPQVYRGRFRTGPEIAFARRIYSNFGGPAHNTTFLKFAYGGTSLESDWLNTSAVDLADRMIIFFSRVRREIEDAGDRLVIRAYIHTQGESDAGSQFTADRYLENLRKLVAKVKAFAGQPNLPIIIMRIHANLEAASPELRARLAGPLATVREAQERFVAETPCSALVKTDQLAQSGLWHFTDPYALGIRQFNAALPLLTKAPCALAE